MSATPPRAGAVEERGVALVIASVHVGAALFDEIPLLARRANPVEVLRDPLYPAAPQVPPVDGVRREVS